MNKMKKVSSVEVQNVSHSIICKFTVFDRAPPHPTWKADANLHSVQCTSVLLSCTLCGASQVTFPASRWWTHSLSCCLLSLCSVSSPASCFISSHKTSTSLNLKEFKDYSLIFFCATSSFMFLGCTGQSMESIPSSPVVKRPGETLSLSCRGSGFTFGCCTMHWIRQPAGKALEWIGRGYSTASRNTYASSVRGRAEISREDSNSMVHLRLSNFQPEDSAVCYCAKDTQWLMWAQRLYKNSKSKSKEERGEKRVIKTWRWQCKMWVSIKHTHTLTHTHTHTHANRSQNSCCGLSIPVFQSLHQHVLET